MGKVNERRALSRIGSTQTYYGDLLEASRVGLEYCVDERCCAYAEARDRLKGHGGESEGFVHSGLDAIRNVRRRFTFEVCEDTAGGFVQSGGVDNYSVCVGTYVRVNYQSEQR